MATNPELDLFVIGAGSGGVRAARMAAQRGARVMVAEAGPAGGTCVNLGCIPKKLYSYAAHFGEGFHDAQGFGWKAAPATLDWDTLKKNRATEISRLNGVYEKLLAGAGAELVRGFARVVGLNEVAVGERRFRAKHILIATGAKPLRPASVTGGELAVTSDDMFDLPVFPKRLVVVGAGYIACEMASIFQGLGSQVTQVVRGPRLLRGFDDDVAHHVQAEMIKKGIAIELGHQVRHIDRLAFAQGRAHGLRLTLDDGTALEADVLLHATGRGPNTQALGLDEVGVKLGAQGEVCVDAHYATNIPSILAIGDVTNRVQLTPVALAEAMVVVDRLFGEGKRGLDYELIPTAVFTHPNIGTVGLTEAQARERYREVRIFKSEFKPLVHTLSGSTERTLMKLVVDAASDRVVGLHMVGADAGEIVQGFAVALRAGATKAAFDATIGIHPTAAEEFVTMREPVKA